MVDKAQIGRFDGELKLIAFNEGDTVRQLVDKAGYELGPGESINDECGVNVCLSSPAKNGETYYIVGNYKQGC